jgi:hypothetical protein
MIQRLSAIAILSLGCLGCESTSNYVPPPPGALEESLWRDRVIMSTNVKTRVAVDQVLEDRQNGLLRTQIEMHNITSSEQSFRTLIEWFDVAGFKLDSPNDGWMSHIVHPNQTFSVSANAVNPAAVSWRLNIDTWGR